MKDQQSMWSDNEMVVRSSLFTVGINRMHNVRPI